jgi:acetyltransferase
MVCPNLNLPTRPYPSQYISVWTAKDGTAIVIRPIRPDDEPLMVAFHEKLSDRTVYLRYLSSLNLANRTAHERLAHICACDYVSEMVLVAEVKEPNTCERRILAVGRLNKLITNSEAEVALLVADPYQRLGIGTQLLCRLIEIARQEGIHRMVAEMLPDNFDIQALFRKCGFRLCSIDQGVGEMQAVLDL